MEKRYKVREFAEVTGVTVRALHHYERLKLLRPCRTESGYRVYGTRDLQRLEQIVALRFLGIPLRQIQTLLDQDPRELGEILAAQRRALEEKRSQVDKAIHAIRDVERLLSAGREAQAAAWTKIIEVIGMQDNPELFKKYYSDEAWAKVGERRAKWDPSMQEGVTKAWTDLFRDVEASLDKDPASPEAQALASRWQELVEAFTGADPGVTEGVKNVWADQQNWPSNMRQAASPFMNKAVWEYIAKVRQAAKR